VRQPGRRRHFLRGQFVIRSGQLLDALGARAVGAEEGAAEELVVDFRDPAPAEKVVEQVKALWDAGLTYREIATRVGWNRNIVAAAVALWHRQRGLEPPDGRRCKKRLARETRPGQLAEEAKGLWDQGLLMKEIASRLDCNHDTATRAIQHWFRSRGLEEPDGRARRKGLPHKSSGQDRPGGPDEGQGGPTKK
jgi:transposase